MTATGDRLPSGRYRTHWFWLVQSERFVEGPGFHVVMIPGTLTPAPLPRRKRGSLDRVL